MSPASPPSCPRCGASIPARADGQLCPACLLSVALEPTASEGKAGETPPPGLLGEPAEFPCEFGGYRLLGILGSGGMGTVYEAEQIDTARRVAVKVLGHRLDSTEARQRFLREGRLAAGIRHPNSLYVFGTEEIAGRPVFTMEIASGGTLNDRLKRQGPLPVADTVDAILDVIAGLEAALAVGVLHRDVKPSNCFVSTDGSVKIGDFGLSVSTLARDESCPTGTGVIMGTPAFASPEQLRGMDLDLRSDVYSVGATLFTLLAGKPPLGGRNAVEIVAAALENRPTQLSDERPDIPTGLANVVARCLAKKPQQRYADYAALHRALLPFGSTRAEPAPMGARLVAGFLDIAVCGILPAVAIHAFAGFDIDDRVLFLERSAPQIFAWAGLALISVIYSTVFEGIWGAGLGKALMGLRVARRDGHGPGFGRALARGLLSAMFGNLGKLVCLALISDEAYAAGGYVLVGASNLVALLAFATMRRRNGLATVWDLATGTRVVIRPTGSARPSFGREATPEESSAEGEPLGPFRITGTVRKSGWMTGYDPALRRTVWLRKRATRLESARRDVARPGRNRWLQSVEGPAGTWDVFEAPPGQPLPRRVEAASGPKQRGLPWDSLRHWLHDLADEIGPASQDGTLPAQLSLDHVWVTAEGRALLLDEPWPTGPRTAERVGALDLAGRQRFLQGVASCVDPATVPLHARAFLGSLSGGTFESFSFVTGNLRSLCHRPAKVSRQQRAASLLAVPIFLVVFLALIVVGDQAAGGATSTQDDLPNFLVLPMLILFALGALLAIPQLLGLLTIRTTPEQLVFGYAVVSAGGEPAGRGRLLARWLIVWTLPIVAFALCGWAAGKGWGGWSGLGLLLLLPWLAGLVYAAWRPARGLQDRWTGSYLVPR